MGAGVIVGVGEIVGVGVIVGVDGVVDVVSRHGSSIIVAPSAIRLESSFEASAGDNVLVTGANVVGSVMVTVTCCCEDGLRVGPGTGFDDVGNNVVVTSLPWSQSSGFVSVELFPKIPPVAPVLSIRKNAVCSLVQSTNWKYIYENRAR